MYLYFVIVLIFYALIIFQLCRKQSVAILTSRFSALSSTSGSASQKTQSAAILNGTRCSTVSSTSVRASHRTQSAAILNDTRCSTVSSSSVRASHRTQSAEILDVTDVELFSLAPELTSQRTHSDSAIKIPHLGQGLRNREKNFSVIYENQ